MHLLKRIDAGEFSLIEDLVGNKIPYFIFPALMAKCGPYLEPWSLRPEEAYNFVGTLDTRAVSTKVSQSELKYIERRFQSEVPKISHIFVFSRTVNLSIQSTSSIQSPHRIMDADLLKELEEMALTGERSVDPDEKAIQTWMALGYTRSEAKTEIANVTKVQSRKPIRKPTTFEFRQTVHILLAIPFDTPDKVKVAAALEDIPKVKEGTSEDGEIVRMCSIGLSGRLAIEDWISSQGLAQKPFFITTTKALKSFDSRTCYPTLGISSTTLPQFRPSSVEASFRPRQDEYPVWYFFYGTLANEAILSRLLNLSGPLDLREAMVRGGKVKTLGRYNAMVDSSASDIVHGKAYLVEDQSEEDALLCYETCAYDVVRCQIWFEPGFDTVNGCVFRIWEGADVR